MKLKFGEEIEKKLIYQDPSPFRILVDKRLSWVLARQARKERKLLARKENLLVPDDRTGFFFDHSACPRCTWKGNNMERLSLCSAREEVIPGPPIGAQFRQEEIQQTAVWLITNPALYYPLDNRDTKQRQSPKEAVKPTVCLWKTEIHVKPPANGLVIKDHPAFKGVCVVKGKQKVLGEFMGSLSWEKSSMPKCQPGISMMEIYVIDQAVLHFLIHNPPTTPEDFNFHAELKAASEWRWPKDDKAIKRASGPHDDWRVKKVAAIALKSWREELCHATKQTRMDDENTDSIDNLEEYISDLEEDIFNLSMYYKGTLEETDDDNLPSIDTPISNGVDGSSKFEKYASPRRSPRRKLNQSEQEDGTSWPAKRSFHSDSPSLKKRVFAAQ